MLTAKATFPGINGEIVVQTTHPIAGTGIGDRSMIFCFDPDTGEQVRQPWIEGPSVRVPWRSNSSKIRFEPDGLRFLGVLQDGDNATGRDGYSLQNFFEQDVRQTFNPGGLYGTYASPTLDGRVVFYWGISPDDWRGNIAVMTPETGLFEVLASPPTATARIDEVLASPVSSDVYYGVFDGTLGQDDFTGSIWRLRDGEPEQLKVVRFLGELQDISPDGRWLLYCDRGGDGSIEAPYNPILNALDLENPSNPPQSWPLPPGHTFGINAVFSPDGKKLVQLKGWKGIDGMRIITLDRTDPDALGLTDEVGNIAPTWNDPPPPAPWNYREVHSIAWRQNGVIRFEAERLPGAEPGEITFTNTSIAGDGSGDPLIPISWDFGDGSDLRESQAPSVIHTFEEQGTYEVTLTVRDQEGNPRSASQKVVVGPPGLLMGLSWDEEIETDGRLPESTTFPATLTVRATSQGLGSIDNILFENGELARFSPLGVLSIASEFDPASGFSLEPGEKREIPVELTTSGLGRVTIRSGVSGTSFDGTVVDASLEMNERVGSDLIIGVTAEVRSNEEGEGDSFVAFPAEGIELEFDEEAGLPRPRDVRLTFEIRNVSGDIADKAMLDVSTLVQTLEDRDPNAPDAMNIFGYQVGDGDPVAIDPAVAKVEEIPLGRIEVGGTLTVVVEAKAQNKGIVEAKGLAMATGLAVEAPHEPTRTLTGYRATTLRIAQPVLLVVDGDPDSPGPIGVQRAGAEPWEFVGLVKNVSPDRSVDLTVLTEATGNVIGGPLRELLVEGGNPFGFRQLIEPGETVTLYGRYLHHGGGGSHGKVEMHLYGKVEDEDAPEGVRPVLDSEILVKEFGVDDFPATERQVRIDLRDPVPAAVEWYAPDLVGAFTENFTIGLATWLETNWESIQNVNLAHRASTFMWYAMSVMWENRTEEEYNRIRDELATSYQAIMDVDAAEAVAAVENAMQNKILEVASKWETGDVPYLFGAAGSFFGNYVPDVVVTESMIARAATLRFMRRHGASAMARAEAAQLETLAARLAAEGRKGFRGGDPVTFAQAFRHWGMDWRLDRALRDYCERKKIIVAIRDRSPGSVAKLEQGLLGKIESVKAKNVNELDLHLGFHPDHLDTAMFKRMHDWDYYRVKVSPDLQSDSDFMARLKARWETRCKEWHKEAPKNQEFEMLGKIPTPPKQYGMNLVDNGYPELKDVKWEQRDFQLGRTKAEGNIKPDLTPTQDGMPAYQPRVWAEGDGHPAGFRAFTGDMDMIAITDVNGNLLSKERRTEVYRELAELGFEHPESLTWDNIAGRAEYIADYDVRIEGSDALLGYGPGGMRRAIKLDAGKVYTNPVDVIERFVLLHGATYDWNGPPPTANPENSTDNIPDTVDALDLDAPDPLGDPNIYLGVGNAQFETTSDTPLLRMIPGGTYERYDPNTKKWSPYTPPSNRPVSQLPQSSLTANLLPGETHVPIIEQDGLDLPDTVAQDWFEPGHIVIINPGGDTEERLPVRTLSSIVLMEPLRYPHVAGEIIAVLPGSIAPPGIIRIVNVANAGFEDPEQGEGEFLNGDIPNWTLGSYGAGDSEWLPVGGGGGSWNPNEGAGYPGGSSFSGNNNAWVISGAQTDVGLSQVLEETLQINTRYLLSVRVGNPLYNRSDETAPFRVELLAGGVLLESITGNSPSAGVWQQQSLTYTSGAGHGQLGEVLEIRLIAEAYTDDNGVDGYEVDFDEVVLTAEPVGGLKITGVTSTRSDGLTQIELEWTSIPGLSYAVEVSDDLVNWSQAASGILADEETTRTQLPPSAQIARYYRVRRE